MADDHEAILVELRYIREDIGEIKTSLTGINGRVRETEKDVARLNVKAGVWGALGGIIAGVATAFGIGR